MFVMEATRSERSLWGHRRDSWFPVAIFDFDEQGVEQAQQHYTTWSLGPLEIIREQMPRYMAGYRHPNPPEYRAEDAKVEAIMLGGYTRWQIKLEWKRDHA